MLPPSFLLSPSCSSNGSLVFTCAVSNIVSKSHAVVSCAPAIYKCPPAPLIPTLIGPSLQSVAPLRRSIKQTLKSSSSVNPQPDPCRTSQLVRPSYSSASSRSHFPPANLSNSTNVCLLEHGQPTPGRWHAQLHHDAQRARLVWRLRRPFPLSPLLLLAR